MSCGLTATTTSAAPSTAPRCRGRLDAVALVQLGDPLLAPRGDDDLGGVAPAGAEQAGEEGLADPAAAEDRDLA